MNGKGTLKLTKKIRVSDFTWCTERNGAFFNNYCNRHADDDDQDGKKRETTKTKAVKSARQQKKKTRGDADGRTVSCAVAGARPPAAFFKKGVVENQPSASARQCVWCIPAGPFDCGCRAKTLIVLVRSRRNEISHTFLAHCRFFFVFDRFADDNGDFRRFSFVVRDVFPKS